MKSHASIYLRSGFIAAVLALTSCGVIVPARDDTQHFLLDANVPERTVSGSSPAIAIARPSLPAYLSRLQLVRRDGNGELTLRGRSLWGEPLDAGIARVTALNLGRLTRSLNVQPAEAFVGMDYEQLLQIQISRFETDPSGSCVLECTWKLQPVRGDARAPRAFRAVIPSAATPEAQVAAMNQALDRLAREVASSL